jgi:hypothetical protein
MRHVALWSAAVLALAAAPAALADGYAGYALQTGTGVVSANGKVRYVAVAAGQAASASTTVESISTADGSILRSLSVIGSFGTPFIAQPQDGLGLSADGRTLVLADVPTTFPHTRSAFSFFSTRPLEYQTGVSLKGDFAFDALSPDGRRLYLIQHVDPGDPSQLRYVVRALDVTTLRLLPGRIADRTQNSWIMRGAAVTRTTSPGGRWVYTLYDDPGGYPFVHALDTVRGVAHCVGLPWTGAEMDIYNMRLSLRDRGGTLAVGFASGRRWMTVDTRTWRISPDGGGTAWRAPALAAGAGTLVLMAVAALLFRRRRARMRVDDELAGLLGEMREPEPVA